MLHYSKKQSTEFRMNSNYYLLIEVVFFVAIVCSIVMSTCSDEDTNWKIAATCLTNQFGSQFIKNRDVRCASSQVVLSISRMQRAGCKSCESYFHCEGFSKALKECKDNYDVQDTLSVMRECKGLTLGETESMEATKAPSLGIDCQKTYLCDKGCKYNPMDGTCPKNICQTNDLSRVPIRRPYSKDRQGRLTSVAYPSDSPIKDRVLDKPRVEGT